MGVPTSEVGYNSATARRGGPRKFVWTYGGIREKKNLLSLVEDLEDYKIIKLLERYLYKTTSHNFDACPIGKPQMKNAWGPLVVNCGW